MTLNKGIDVNEHLASRNIKFCREMAVKLSNNRNGPRRSYTQAQVRLVSGVYKVRA